MEKSKQKIIPNLWFDKEAEEAVKFYTGLFENAVIHDICRYPDAGCEIHGQEPGLIMTIDFELMGFRLVALNGGPVFQFNPSISLFVIYRSKQKLERTWQQLSKDGNIIMPLEAYEWSPQYGWLQDRYGLSWQFMLENEETSREQIVPLLFFTGSAHGKAEDAIKFYTSIFENSKIEGILKYTAADNNPYALGAVKHAQFQLFGETFMAMDSGVENDFPFNEAVSLIVSCEDQQEIDRYWEKLSGGGDPQAQQCGWLKDKFGVSWQIVPEGMAEIFNHPDKERSNRAMEAMLKMKKLEIEQLKNSGEKSHF